MVKARTKEEFIEKGKSIHKDENGEDKYIYDKVEYKNERTKVKIYCKIHKEYFEQTPSSHLKGSGCLPCGKSKKSQREIFKKKFIEKATKKYGEQYSYKKVVYVNNVTPVIIICKKHNVEFEQRPANFLTNPKCKTRSLKDMKVVLPKTPKKINYPKIRESKDLVFVENNKKKFIEKATKKYEKDNFDYSKVDYLNMEKDVTITCNIHKTALTIKPRCHINNAGGGCIDCKKEEKLKKNITTKEFIKRSKDKYPDKYTYENTDYKGNNVYVTIKCIEHNEEFKQLPSNHYRYEGCRKCSGCPRYNTKTFIERAKVVHENKTYAYEKVDYKNYSTYIIITCKIHGDFKQTPDNHLSGRGCNKCASRKLNTESYIEEAKIVHPTYIYDERSIFTKMKDKIRVICPEEGHGVFWQEAFAHLEGAGCPICRGKTEKGLIVHLRKKYKNVVPQFKKIWCINPESVRHMPYDICIKDYKIIIELDGRQHFMQVMNWGDLEKTRKRDLFKMDLANENGYSMIRISQEDVYYNRANWQKKLDDAIEKLHKSKYVENIYISSRREYEGFNDEHWYDIDDSSED